MPDFPSSDQIAGLVLEPQTIDGEAFLLVTVLLHETRWLNTTPYDVLVSKRSWLSQVLQVGMKDAQGECRCWLEMGFTRGQADYATYRLTRKVQRWTVQVSLEEYWQSAKSARVTRDIPIPAGSPSSIQMSHVVLGTVGASAVVVFVSTGAALVAAGAGGAFLMSSLILHEWLDVLPSGRELVSEGWELEDALQTGQQGLDVASQQLLLAKTHALALQADGTWRSEISITSSLECRLKPPPDGSAQRVQALYCRVTETWPCGQRWLPAELPRGSTVEWVGWAQSGLTLIAPPSTLTEIPALYAPHTAAALAQLEGDPCCDPVGRSGATTEAPKTEAPTEAPAEAPTEAPKTEPAPTPAASNPDTIERLLPAMAERFRRAHLETLSQALKLSDTELRAAGGADGRALRDQLELLLLWPQATAQDVLFLVSILRTSARRMADPREVRELASRLTSAPARTWDRKLAEVGLPQTYDAAALGRALLEWTG